VIFAVMQNDAENRSKVSAMSDGLNADQEREAARIAEIETRRFFDNYLQRVWPQQHAALLQAMQQGIRLHNEDKEAHGRVELKFNRAFWVLLGMAAASGAGAVGLVRLFLSVA
jgi:hypothetical protein